MTTATILKGLCRGTDYTNFDVELLHGPRMGKQGWFVKARNFGTFGDRNVLFYLESESQVVVHNGVTSYDKTISMRETQAVELAAELTDDEIMSRMRSKFETIASMADATVEGHIRALIVTGPAGVGKSHGIELALERQELVHKLGDTKSLLSLEKVAHASPLGLYQLLWQFRHPGSVLVLDDSDSLLFNEPCLNMLKAVTDSGKKRRLTWRTESNVLRDNEIDTEFEFHGSVIFITNLDFEKGRGKAGEHLKAIVSRCHYIDVGIDGNRQKLLRCKQIIGDGMLNRYQFDPWQLDEIVAWLDKNQDRLREISLRTVVKAADLAKMSWARWTEFAEETLLVRT